MDTIQIVVECSNLTVDVDVKVNNTSVLATYKNNILEIKTPIDLGVNMLTLSSSDDTVIKITDVLLNDVSLNQSLYLAYSNGKSNTWLTSESKEINIPFGNPIGWWLGEVVSKIPATKFGQSLYDEYEIYYPLSVKIDNHHPKIIKDFIETNFGFHVVKKSTKLLSSDRPWLKVNVDYNENSIKQELINNLDIIQEESPEAGHNWNVCYLTMPDSKNQILDKLPKVQELLNNIESKGIKIMHSFVGIVQHNSYVYPHSDDFYKHDQQYSGMSGCEQFFIPIGWKDGNYFKFQNVGFVPYDQGALLINPGNFAHGSVNTSGETRFTLGMYCDLTEDNIRDLV